MFPHRRREKRIIIDYCQHRIELEFEFLSRYSWFSKKILPSGMTKEKREKERKFSWISFIKKISAILKNVHYVGLNEKIPSHLQSEENIKVSSMFSNIGEWFFELYIEIQSCSRVKEEGKRGGGGKVRNRATYRRFSIASKTTTILVNPIKWLCAIA